MITTEKITLAALAAALLTSIASAQITPRPASWSGASVDGLNQFLTPLAAPQATSFVAAGLNQASDATVSLPGFTIGTPSISLNPSGGSVTVFFLGETAGWLDDFGYVRNPQTATLTNPAVYNPLVVNVDSVMSGTPSSTNLVDLTSATVNYAAGEKLDFFLNGVGDPGGANGGTWFTFGTPNQFAGTDTSIHTAYRFLTVNGVSTLVVAYEDARRTVADGDFSDFIIAFQGTGLPVPEPSTYGLIGAAALLALVAARRFKR